MASLKENIAQAISDFNSIEAAIEACGVDVPYDTDTAEYGAKVLEVYAKGQAEGAIDVDDELSETSENPVQNKVVTAAIKALKEAGGGGNSNVEGAKVTSHTHDEWMESDPVLAENEIAVATIQTIQDGKVNYAPSVLIKIGNGVSKYSETEFIFGKAADVYEWAKKSSFSYADLPSELITKINTLESDQCGRIPNIELEEILQ